ncbi:heavy-metal-associated domain-containing protein [Lachnospira multipara]|uniref:heavy-metal-associated domain-containing protein n=1 Tax=Lachnospira multipara TaxID=28051 RepID=UPI0004864A4E|nr:heavy metal-associated domain-containing protein [Lachnospira multipara]
MGTVIVVLILAVLVILAISQSKKHLKGEGGCCGGGSDSATLTEIKELEGKIIGKKIISIEGMHCDNCKNSVERSINRIDGARAVVNLKKNRAVVEYDRVLDDEDLRIAVERLDFKVISIKEA